MTERKKPFSVFLDLDETLLDFHTAEAVALSKTLTQFGIEPTESAIARYSEINAGRWELLEEGKISREEALVSRFDLFFEELGADCSGYQAELMYEKLLCIGHWFIPGAQELLEALDGKYDLYIASNGIGAVQDSRLESAGIVHHFKDIFISERLGGNKPQKAFYDACFAHIPDFDRERAIMVGDSLTSDIRGGNNAGIKTCWFNPKGRPRREDIRPDFEITSLNELPALLEKLSK